MSLSDLIKKRPRSFATAISAIPATEAGGARPLIAKIATVAVANPQADDQSCATGLDANDAIEIIAWLESIGEDDSLIFRETLEKCQVNPTYRAAFLRMARGENVGVAH